MRKKYIIGNWKMNMPLEKAVLFMNKFLKLPTNMDPEVGIAPSYTEISKLVELSKGCNIRIGAQNFSHHETGAYTGDVSVSMLKEHGVSFSLVGHSERRIHNQESDASVNSKIKIALKHDIQPVLCIGENEEIKKAGLTISYICNQIKKGIDGLTRQDIQKLIIAYEPVWAIGSGYTATPKDTQNLHLEIRAYLSDLYSSDVGKQIPILYGGSVNAKNSDKLLSEPDIDGLLVGGASLDPKEFYAIITSGMKKNTNTKT